MAIVLFVVLLPVFMMVALLVWVTTGSNPFFTQRRPGKNGVIFRLVKFKSMNNRNDASGNLLPDAQRLTPIGRFIRKTSLDEIPQLLNVIKGDMSLVGPRPLLEEYLPLYDAVQSRRHEVLPGITGWAQVNGRNAISWEEKFAYDVWYVDHVSLATDLKIVLLTINNVIGKKGVNSNETTTMEKFSGN